MNTALARDLRRILGRIAFWGLAGHFLLVAGVLAGPWSVDAATIALIGSYSTGPIMALGGLLTLMAVLHGVKPEDMPGEHPKLDNPKLDNPDDSIPPAIPAVKRTSRRAAGPPAV